MFPFSSMMLAASTFSLSVSPASASGSGYNGATETSSSVTVTPVGPGGYTYTYAWARISGSALISADSPTAATTTFSGVTPNNSTINAVFRCTATRSDGATATKDVAVDLTATTAPSLTVTYSPFGDTVSHSAGSAYSQVLTAIVTGGSGSYTYGWSLIHVSGPGSASIVGSGDNVTLVANGTPGTSDLWRPGVGATDTVYGWFGGSGPADFVINWT